MEAGGSGGAEKSPNQESVLVHAVSFSDFLLFFVAVTAFVVLVSKMAKKNAFKEATEGEGQDAVSEGSVW